MLFRKHNLTNLIHLITIITGLVSHVTPKKCLEHLNVSQQHFRVENNNELETWNLTLETSQESLGHQLITHTFAIFLKEVLGYDAVQVVSYPIHYNVNSTTDILRRLSGTELMVENGAVFMSPLSNNTHKIPETMINVAVWPSPEMELEKWNTPGIFLENCGHLGFVGRFGWFIPKLPVTDKYPTVEYWRTFRTNTSLTELFNLEDSDYQNATTHLAWNPQTERFYCHEAFCESGMFTPDVCRNDFSNSGRSKCAILLASYPESSMFLPEEISSLGLRVMVIWLGPNLESFVRHLVSKYQQPEGLTTTNRAVMFFSWDPTRLTSELDLISISFPTCTGGVHCRYESLRLEKFVSSKLKLGAKLAFEAAHRLSITYEEYKKMMEMYTNVTNELENEVVPYTNGEKTKSVVEHAACQWMKENKLVWESWEPKGGNGKTPLFIGGIFPISGSYTARGILVAAQMATIAVNHNNSVLKDYELSMHVYDGQCRADKVMKGFIDFIRLPTFPSMAGILGPACSDTAEPLAGVATHFKTVVISYSAEGSSFSDRDKYPYFFRTIGENKQYQHVYLDLFRQLSWTRVASLTEEGQKYAEYVSSLQDLLQENHIAFIANRKFPKDRPALNMSQYLQDLKSKKAKIIIGDFYDHAARAVMCEAYHQKMTAREGFVWFLPVWFLKDWYDTNKHNQYDEKENIPCNTTEMIQAINGHLSLQYAYFAPEDHLMQESVNVSQWRNRYDQNCQSKNISTSDYAGYAYDAIWTYAYALDKLLEKNHSLITNLHADKTTNELVRIISETDFHGVSGHIKFVGGPSRISTIHVVQWYNRTTNIVGTWYPKKASDQSDGSTATAGHLALKKELIKWLTPDQSVPNDGSEPPTKCVLETLASALDVTCEVAIVIANVIGFGILGFILVICFLVIKRRYDKKVQMTQDYFKALGIDILSATNVSALDKWEVPRDRVVINRKLGEGAFGTVYGGECFFDDRGWVAVAVKTLKVGSSCEQKLDFLGEAEVMKRFEHKNIVRLLGVCTKNEPIYTIMEFMLYGDLKTYLLARRHLVNEKNCEESDEISSRRLTSMSLDVARALSYLAELKYVHRDVACRNCLVNASRVVKLGDFGMTRPMYENDYYRFNRKGMLPVRWMAPESLALGIFTPMSDVWSFGVLLYEIITFGSFPFQGKSNNEVLDYVKLGNTVSIPSGVKPQLEQLLKGCWSIDAQKRPAAAVIVEFLANNPRIISPSLDMPLASVQLEGTDQLEIQIPDRIFNRKAGSTAVRNGGKGMPKATRESRDMIGNNLSASGEENIPLTGQKTYGNRNQTQSSYVSLHHEPSSVEADLI
ncbi:unnamed protein product [Orchesella dallaii]|uniref:Protein kinase domain-containing protein n=1 Tax=Orchesella dallaii TaxID=48710 RepID=A0ABP1QVI3_9HEXA